MRTREEATFAPDSKSLKYTVRCVAERIAKRAGEEL